MSEEEHTVDGVQALKTGVMTGLEGMNSPDWASELWRRGCERLATELPEQQFNTWIRPLPPATVSGEAADSALVATLKVPNHFKRDWIRRQYAARIEAILTELAGRPTRLELSLVARDASSVPITRPS
jgi:chromosomal replication initiator protein